MNKRFKNYNNIKRKSSSYFLHILITAIDLSDRMIGKWLVSAAHECGLYLGEVCNTICAHAISK